MEEWVNGFDFFGVLVCMSLNSVLRGNCLIYKDVFSPR